MTEWLYNQKREEIAEQHEDFKLDAVYELMQKLVDIKDENKIKSYIAISNLRLELTAKAHGSDLSAEEISENEFLLAGVEQYDWWAAMHPFTQKPVVGVILVWQPSNAMILENESETDDYDDLAF